MKTKSLIFAVTFILSLALLSCAYASDVNETVIADDQSFIEDTVVCEDEIADVSLNSSNNEIILEEENPADVAVIDNNDMASFEIVNAVEYSGEESDFEIENYEAPDYIGFLNDSQFCDVNIESDEKLDATFNNNISIMPFVKLNISPDNIGCFEFFLIKMEDFDSSSFNEGKFKNSFAFKHELMVYVLHENNFDNCLDCDIVICSNKVTDNFAYSINNSVIGDESSVVYCSFNSSYFIQSKLSIFNIIICSNKVTDNFAYSINNSISDDECSVVYCSFNSSYFIQSKLSIFNYNFFSSVSNFSSLLYDGCLDYNILYKRGNL